MRRVLPLALAAAFAVTALAADGSADLAIGNDPTLGDILVDGSGNTLYLFLPDARGDSTCYDACAENWPPLLSDGETTLGEGLDSSLLGAVTRTDDTEQVTYGGWPLYTFARDTEPGQIAGQGLNEVWYVLNAEGDAVGAPEDAAASAEDGGDSESVEGENAEDEGAAGASGADEAGGEMAALMDEGAVVFAGICAACHGANGDESLVEHAAILADNSRLENERRVIRRVIHGGGYMPSFGSVLSDREVAAVVTFVRNSWGNEYGLVGEEAAAEMR